MKKLNEILGTKYPFIQGGMANIATGEFAAACSNAGALGMIATGGWDGDRLRKEIRRAKELTDKPFGVNLMLMSPYADDIAQVILEEDVKVVTTGAGNPGKYIPAWKEKGIKVIPVVAAAVLAKRLERYGVDAIIAEGTESGGHVGEMTTMALVPQVIDAVSVPVVAAGGIADGRQGAAASSRGPAPRGGLRPASPPAVRPPPPSPWAPAASRWAPVCLPASSAPSTTTTSRPFSRPRTPTRWSPAGPSADRSGS